MERWQQPLADISNTLFMAQMPRGCRARRAAPQDEEGTATHILLSVCPSKRGLLSEKEGWLGRGSVDRAAPGTWSSGSHRAGGSHAGIGAMRLHVPSSTALRKASGEVGSAEQLPLGTCSVRAAPHRLQPPRPGAPWVGTSPIDQKVVGSIPRWDTNGRQSTNVSLSLPSFLALSNQETSPWVRILKNNNKSSNNRGKEGPATCTQCPKHSETGA